MKNSNPASKHGNLPDSDMQAQCCTQPENGTACCTPTISTDACCEESTDSSACCTPVSDIIQELDQPLDKPGLPVAIIGGGPIGLAAAAHLHQRGESFILFEAGDDIAASIQSWHHVRVFSPWRYNLDAAAAALLDAHGWQPPPLNELHTGGEFVEQYLRPLANLPELSPYIHLSSRVLSVGRKGLDKMKTADRDQRPFIVTVVQDQEVVQVEARAVIDASGTWTSPNPIGSGGIMAQGETEARDKIFYGIPDVLGRDKARYAGKRVLVVGSGHSAINSLLDLHRLKEEFLETEVIWALRRTQMQAVYGGEANDALPARGALGSHIRQIVDRGDIRVVAPFHVQTITMAGGNLSISGMLDEKQTTISDIDEIIACTGARPDMSFLREVRASVDPVLESVPDLAPLIDPNIHSCGTVRPHGEQELRQPEKDFYIVGMKSYGRAPTFLLATGYEQVRSVAAALVGDWGAAAQVELNLPETGVCSSNFIPEESAACCGTEPAEVEVVLA